MAKKKRISEPEPLFKVGDRVRFPFGSGEASGIIVEDRGCLGVGGRRLYGINIEWSPGETSYAEMPEVELTAVPQSTQVPERRALEDEVQGLRVLLRAQR